MWLLVPVLAAAITGGRAHAQTPVPGLAGTDGIVRSFAVAGQKLVIAGDFERVGRPCGSWVSFDLATGAAEDTGPVVVGDVWEAIPDGLGGFFIGGRIRAVNGIAHQGLAHLEADGSLSPWAPTVTGLVDALALRGDTLFVGGSFSQVNGIPRSNLAALDVWTGALLPWSVPVDGRVRALDLVDDTLYIGGDFRAIAGLSRPGIGAIDARIASPSAWTLPLVGSPFAAGTPFVTEIVHDGGRLLIGGDFKSVGAEHAGGFAVVDRATGALQASAHPEGAMVQRILVHGSRVYVSGDLVMSTPAGNTWGLFAISRSTLQVAAWAPAFPRSKRMGGAIAAHGDRVFVSESWWDISFPPEPLNAVDTVSGGAVAFPAPLRASGGASVFSTSGGRLFAGGPFQLSASTPRHSLAEVDLPSGNLTSRTFDLLPGEWVFRVAGEERVFAWTLGKELIAFDASSTPIWRRPFFDAQVMRAVQGHLFVVGRETSAASQTVYDLDPTTGATQPWAPAFANPSGPVSVDALTFDDQRLYVGGFFESVNGQSTGGVAAFRWSDLALEPVSFGAIHGVRALAVAPGRVIAVGDVAGRVNPTLAALDVTNGALLPWDPPRSLGLDPYRLRGMCVLDDDVILGYQHDYSPNGQPLFYRASLSASTWMPGAIAGWGRTADVQSQAGRLVVVGDFIGFDSVAASGVGVLASPTLGVPAPAATQAGELAVWPDPARDRVAIRWSHVVAPARLEVMDISGRRVWAVTPSAPRTGLLEWDLRGSDGQSVRPGVHFVVGTAHDGSRWTARFVVLR